ncbi:TetR/AcrR family transcriptional regulator [Pseudoflavitalea sp. G-6-1-2]|uniref:TetR/AcrR family transcriptional regulator n=1 Tax=Pseudoflavitalea sp. G-6-1-2 TaxID=2728841 RepID=UPI00146E3D95|nr:TetR/AcrR family transcriptional regulator [Pseudoflavitalea sp. G-6-1-2]NML22420.1 TetR/AcrR family transcriptional regulator [Pseudoflavitalea sp. G-6-1-2]
MTKKEALKQKIREAALQCFTKYGLEKTTLDDIAKLIGLNKASLYYYYKNKEDLFVEAALAEGRTYIEALQQKTVKKKGLEAQIWFYLDSRFKYYVNVLNVSKISPSMLTKMLPRFFELYEDFRKQEQEFLTVILKEAMQEGVVAKGNPGKIASLLIDISDALKHYEEQKSILKGSTSVEYANSLQNIKHLVSIIFHKPK